ncbi:hypothetical protein PR202_gb08917 [Eleusine coracana subsp. coracana]|uniref:Uncharacterized protein n=1 Tax=Eleusine coracana subsp. coracana TaxID=191504 RepID=A0AAV5EE80_ELECO|nr:hypothetical protein PR202_gb08917 [Eleusine coracana subsp. coracana]
MQTSPPPSSADAAAAKECASFDIEPKDRARSCRRRRGAPSSPPAMEPSPPPLEPSSADGSTGAEEPAAESRDQARSRRRSRQAKRSVAEAGEPGGAPPSPLAPVLSTIRVRSSVDTAAADDLGWRRSSRYVEQSTSVSSLLQTVTRARIAASSGLRSSDVRHCGHQAGQWPHMAHVQSH